MIGIAAILVFLLGMTAGACLLLAILSLIAGSGE